MKNAEINEALAVLNAMADRIDSVCEANDGEITPEVEAMMEQADNIRALLEGDGIDSLGRWLKSVEDKKNSLKAEKDSIQRQMDACDKTIDFVKTQVRRVLDTIGTNAAKGTCYSFTSSDSAKVETDTALLKEKYQDKAQTALRKAGIPDYVGFALKGVCSLLPEGEPLPEFFHLNEKKTVTFRKPKADKEKQQEA